jgi:Fungal protein kinase
MAQPEARGHDSTVGSAKPHEIGLAKATVPELAKANSFLAVTASDGRFIIRGPDAQPAVPVGRWTRTSFAYDVNNKRRVILKDSWRIRADDIEPKGKIYEILHANHVPNIPHFSCAGDVGDDPHHQTRTDEVFEKGCISRHSCWEPITRHRHYRIVLLTVGRKLEEFKDTKEFVEAMLAALKGGMTIFLAVSLPDSHLTHIIAHKAAWDIRILHRDISPGNILIVSSNELGPNDSGIKDGLLIDWDLSEIVTDEKLNTAHQYSRTVS